MPWIRPGQAWNAAIVLVVLMASVAQIVLVVQGKHVLTEHAGALPPVRTRIIRFFSYFTIDSNILCAVSCALLALNPSRDGRLWRVIRLNALVGISVTGIIYVTLLRPLVDLQGVPKLTDIAFHYVVPLATVMGWLLFRPPDQGARIDSATLLPACVFPAAYMLYTVVHGEVSNWYPYPFTDVGALGYQIVVRNAIGITVLLLGCSVLFMMVDRWLADRFGPVGVLANS
jgi:hypothetical protein